jgi:hypothetical protein
MERRRAHGEKQTPRTLLDLDYLSLVDDKRCSARCASRRGRGPFLRETVSDSDRFVNYILSFDAKYFAAANRRASFEYMMPNSPSAAVAR